MVDGYTLLEVLGSGTVGTVHRAEDRHHPGRIVAVKRVPDARGGRGAVAHEVAALDRLSHPSIVRVLDVVADGEGAALVTPFLPGGSLADRIARRGPLPVEEVADLGARLGDALASAHDAGVLHRDVKPANILYDAEEQPLLADFGAALLDQGADGWIVGSATYLDPALAVDGAPPGPHADQYALAVSLYEALAGVPPYAAPTSEATLRTADRGVHVPLADLAPHAPPALCATIERGLARAPTDRFATVRELASHCAEVRGSLAAEPGPTAPTWRATGATPRPPAPAGPRPSTRTTPTSPPGPDEGPPPPPPEPIGAPTGASSPRGPQATTRFGPAPPAAPTPRVAAPRRPRAVLIAAAIVVLLVPLGIVVALVWGDDRSAGITAGGATGDAPRPELPRCDGAPPPPPGGEVRDADLDGSGCTVPVAWDAETRVLTVPTESGPARFQLGEPADQLLIGAWRCDGRDAPALYRPATGQVFTFGRFGGPGDELESQPAQDTGVVDGQPRVVRDEDDCDRVEVDPA